MLLSLIAVLLWPFGFELFSVWLVTFLAEEDAI
jgi:hypothetical protein